MQLRFPKFPLVVSVAVLSFVLVFALVMMSRSQPNTQSVWRPANSILPPAFVEKVIASNYEDANGLSPKFVEVLPIGGRNSKTFYVFRFNTSGLCGKAGCLHAVYNEQGVRVLSLLLNKNKPANYEIFAASQNLRNDYPCLLVTQAINSGVQQTEFCLNGSALLRVNSSFESGAVEEPPLNKPARKPSAKDGSKNRAK